MAEEVEHKVVYCPRCDRPFAEATLIKVWDRLVNHVREAHPDYDPEWYETGDDDGEA